VTVSTTGGGAVVPYDEDANLGFEDVDQSDLSIPRLTIRHADGVLVNSLTKAEYTSLDVVLLGQIKQRIMWAKETEDGDRPLCKSPDFSNGFPEMSDELPKDKRFPWATSGLKLADFPPSDGINGLSTIGCASCMHKEWNNPNTPGQKKPLCDEQHTFPLMYTEDAGESWTTALFSVQRTGLKPMKAYVSGFVTSKMPMFRFVTRIELNMQSRGTVTYCIPTFKRTVESDRAMWPTFADTYRSARDFVRQPPQNYDEPTEEGDNTNGPAPVAAPAPAPVQRAAPAAPVARPAARPAPAPVAAPVAAPVVEADPWTEPAPVESAAAPVEDDDDLPF
jgi:hypothetical protein